MNLYELLPAIIRYKDGVASGNVGLSANDGIVKKIVDSIEEEAQTSADLVAGLKDLISIEEADEQYLPHIARSLGTGFAASWSADRRRLFLRALMLFYFQSGQHQVWKALLRFSGYPGVEITELWKNEIYSKGEYSITQDEDYYTNDYHAARVDLFLAYSGPISVVNSASGAPVYIDVGIGLFKQAEVLYSGFVTVTNSANGNPIYLNVIAGMLYTLGSALLTANIVVTDSSIGVPVYIDVKDGLCRGADETISDDSYNLIDQFRPIHVLIRTQHLQTNLEDVVDPLENDVVVPGAGLAVTEQLAVASDVCASLCETVCEVFCEAGSCEGTFELTLTCVLSCEVSCQSICETGCQTGCEVIVEVP